MRRTEGNASTASFVTRPSFPPIKPRERHEAAFAVSHCGVLAMTRTTKAVLAGTFLVAMSSVFTPSSAKAQSITIDTPTQNSSLGAGGSTYGVGGYATADDGAADNIIVKVFELDNSNPPSPILTSLISSDNPTFSTPARQSRWSANISLPAVGAGNTKKYRIFAYLRLGTMTLGATDSVDVVTSASM